MKKYIYIKNNHKGKFLEFNEPFDEKLFNNVGTLWKDYEDGKWVMLSQEQIKFHEDNPTASEKEVWEMKITPKPQPINQTHIDGEPIEHEDEQVKIDPIEMARQEKIKEIDAYQPSCTINGNSLWLNKEERKELKESIKAYRQEKEETMTKWIDNNEYTFELNKWASIVCKLDVYDSKVQNNQNAHKNAIMKLDTQELIQNYDITVGYPQILNL
jgi:hypothetical protein